MYVYKDRLFIIYYFVIDNIKCKCSSKPYAWRVLDVVVAVSNIDFCPYDSSRVRNVLLRAFSSTSRIEHAALQLHVVFCISTLYFVAPTKADAGAANQANLGMSRLPCSHSAFSCVRAMVQALRLFVSPLFFLGFWDSSFSFISVVRSCEWLKIDKPIKVHTPKNWRLHYITYKTKKNQKIHTQLANLFTDDTWHKTQDTRHTPLHTRHKT